MFDPSAPFDPTDWLRFVQLDPFLREWRKQKLTDDDLRDLEVTILETGESQPVIPGTGGLRKIRFAPAGSGQGKRGSLRVCYCLVPNHGIVLLTTVYGKNEKSNLNAADRAAIARVIAAIAQALDQGTIR